MYRELIANAAKNIKYSVLQPPCPESEIAKAEAYIGYRFPHELRALLKETNGDRFLLLSVDEIVEQVRHNRKNYAEHLDEDLYAETENSVFFAANGIGIIIAIKLLKTAISTRTPYISGNTKPLNIIRSPLTSPSLS